MRTSSIDLAGLNDVLDYYATGNGLVKDKDVEKLIKQRSKDKLEK